jgi:hypothetical protein
MLPSVFVKVSIFFVYPYFEGTSSLRVTMKSRDVHSGSSSLVDFELHFSSLTTAGEALLSF